MWLPSLKETRRAGNNDSMYHEPGYPEIPTIKPNTSM